MTRRIRVLHPSSAWRGGHVLTCINLVKGMHRAGADIHIHMIRSRLDMTDAPYSPTVPAPWDRLGLAGREEARRRKTEARFLASLRAGDIVWLWPLVSHETYHEVQRRGHPIIMEGINSRMGSARRILDNVFEAAGLPPGHKITDAKIAQEEEMLAMATHFFAPNAGVEAALAEPDSQFTGQVLPTSYGAWMPDMPPRQETGTGPLTVVFAGRVGLRKNAHGLLRAWAQLKPRNARLLLCGSVDADLARICAQELAMPSVETPGHVGDMAAAYRSGDIFVMPSFEEGGPQVNYEAAGHGLAVIASPMGAGRMQEHEGAALMIDPYDVADMAEKLGMLLENSKLRRAYAQRAYEVAPLFDWNAVGQGRYRRLQEAFGDV